MMTLVMPSMNRASAQEATADEKAPKPAPEKKEPAKDAASETKAAAPAAHTVKRGPFKVEVELDGVFEAARMTPLTVAPLEWAELTVVESVSQGSRVKKGDALVRLDTRKLERLIRDLKAAAPLAEVTLKVAEEEIAAMEKTTPLQLAAARRQQRDSTMDLANFEKTGRAEREEASRQSVKRAEDNLEYAEEELNQLRKMYEADDLTEETEEIIMKRAKNDVESSQNLLERTRLSSERELKIFLPREQERLQYGAQWQEITTAQTAKSIPDALKKKRLEVQKLHRDKSRATQQLKDLERDLSALTVEAPHDGIVYYGTCDKGRWVTAASVEKKLVPGGKLAPREVFMTVVRPRPLIVRTFVPEEKLQHLTSGISAVVSPVSAPDRNLEATVKEISLVPAPAGGFGGSLELGKANLADIYPGMNCKVRALAYEKKDTLTVPKKAVRREGSESVVRLEGGEKRTVRTGKSNEEAVEILGGLKEGDVVIVP